MVGARCWQSRANYSPKCPEHHFPKLRESRPPKANCLTATEPRMTIKKALITLIKAIASCRASHYSGALLQPWSQYPSWLTSSDMSLSHCLGLCPSLHSRVSLTHFFSRTLFSLSDNRCHLLLLSHGFCKAQVGKSMQ